MKLRLLLLAAPVLLVASVPVLAGCGGGDAEGTRDTPSSSTAASASGRPSVKDLIASIRKNAPGVRPEAAACVAEAIGRSELSDAYLRAVLHPDASYQPNEADRQLLMTLTGVVQSECHMGSVTDSNP
jgi:hypothetical protein